MKQIPVNHLARILRVLVVAVLAMNLLCLLLVPGVVAYVSDGGPAALVQAAQAELQSWLNAWQGREAETHFPMLVVFLAAWPAVWTHLDTALLTLFYWLCGGCTAVILWQAKRVLDTILTRTPFLRANAGALKRAAVCCWRNCWRRKAILTEAAKEASHEKASIYRRRSGDHYTDARGRQCGLR